MRWAGRSAEMRKKLLTVLCAVIMMTAILCGCRETPKSPTAETTVPTAQAVETTAPTALASDTDGTHTPPQPEQEDNTMTLLIDGVPVTAEWADNAAVDTLRAALADGDITVRMSMYGGFEQVGSLGMSLPADNEQITTRAGDIVLYNGSQIVIFYGSNSWDYTRLGRVTDKTADELTAMLSEGDVTLTLSLK